MINVLDRKKAETNFINADELHQLKDTPAPSEDHFTRILDKALLLKGLSKEESAALLNVNDPEQLNRLFKTASRVKSEIYGRRLVLFAPLYTGNKCSNNCTYCAFRAGNKDLHRIILSQDQIAQETLALLEQGHKRVLMLCGESVDNNLDYFMDAINTVYETRYKNQQIRRINVEIAPLEVEEFTRLKTANIGTYACFQETYDPEKYSHFHPSGPKSDYMKRLTVMDRAMLGGIDDVGIGALFGLADYRFETLALLTHAEHLEQTFNCGPHTISVPRIEPAHNAPVSQHVPQPVSDEDFKKIIAVLRISLPYTGIILSTRETEELRNELFSFGISQISAGSRTNPGAYADEEEFDASQFSLGDHRSLDEVISCLIDDGYIPSFCTGCYRKGRVGQDFMDLAKPGLIKEFCLPNGVYTFAEYLLDFASSATRGKGFQLIDDIIKEQPTAEKRDKMSSAVASLKSGTRDIYY